ncbi:YadA-like family protein, partial [uncultured Ruegeria sp.]|uniref:YadA-like family protein n=1 Tax=uncultured Ruegeria sp. TaxID=259304 RepID=UPI00262DD080
TNADGIATNADGIATNADGIATNADGIATNADNIATFGDGIDANTGNIATNTKNISQNTARIADLSSQVDTNRAIASDGIAMALAAKVPTLLPDQNGAITFGLGNYDSSTALSIGMTARISYKLQAFGTVGYGFESEKIGSSIGIMYAW